MPKRTTQSGFTILETLIGFAIFSVVSTSIYFAYSSVIQIVQSAQYNSAALSAIESHIETIRNMRYEDVGVAGGVPSGTLAQSATVMVGTTALTMHTYIRNIDDPFDGTLGGVPSDTAPADYKLVEVQVTCDDCARYNVIAMTTYVAPKNLESTSKNGNLFIRVFDGNGIPVAGATVHVTNILVTPAIDLTDVTNVDGFLQLVDTATSSAGYHLTATKTGYTSDQTTPPGNPPNALKPDATVASQQLTIASLEIDRVSTLTVRTSNQFCAPTGSFDFLLTGGKLISTSPDTPKYSVAHSTTVSGTAVISPLEWDTYSLVPTDTVWDIAGTAASLSFTIDPQSDHTLEWMTASRSGNALVVSVVNQSGLPIDDAAVRVHAAGYDRTVPSGLWPLNQTTWSAGAYDSKSSLMDASVPGQLTLLTVAGTYASGSPEWLISNTYDVGSTSTAFAALNWNPPSQPPQTGATSLTFQVAANNDNATWNWVGPDGTSSTFFTTPGQLIPAALNGNRYIRYRAYLQTDVTDATPTLQDVSMLFSSGCIMSGQAYFNAVPAGNYTVDITGAGFQPFTTTVTVDDPWQRLVTSLTP